MQPSLDDDASQNINDHDMELAEIDLELLGGVAGGATPEPTAVVV